MKILNTQSDPILSLRLSLRDSLEFSERTTQRETVVIIEDLLRNKFFQVGPTEYGMLKRLDGSQTVAALLEAPEFADESNRKSFLESVKWALANGLATVSDFDNSARLKNLAGTLRKQRLLSWLNPISIRVPLLNAAPLLSRMERFGRVLFHPISFLVWLVVVAFAAAQFVLHWDEVGQKYMGVFAASEWLVLLVVWTLLKLIHEFGHGLACHRFGGRAGMAGIFFILFTPLAFIDVTSSWRFHNRWHRILTAAAGMYFELFIAALAFIAWSWTTDEFVFRTTLYKVFLTAGLTTVLFNANPLMRYDGYYILSDLVEIPNLYAKGGAWFNGFCNRWIFGFAPLPLHGTRRERVIIRTFGALAFVWRMLISVSLVIGASVLFHGAGIAIAILAVISWFAIPMFRTLQAASTRNLDTQTWHRGAIRLALIAGMVAAVFTVVPGPSSKSAPAVVRYEEEQPLRASSDGFVRAVHVSDGQAVAAGTVLVELENRELQLEVIALREQAQQIEIRARKALQKSEVANYQSETEQLAQFQKRLAEKEHALEQLTVVAPFDGIVMGRDLAWMADRYLERGSIILTMATAERPEIVVSVAQTDIASLQAAENEKFRAVFDGHPIMQCSVRRLDARATMLPVHRSLCGDIGGPLPVRMRGQHADDEMPVELLSPRVNVELEVPADLDGKLLAGQTGNVIFTADRHSLGTFLILQAHDWIEHKLEMALGGETLF
jgi:putative peptide zinc metalloprotease protein